MKLMGLLLGLLLLGSTHFYGQDLDPADVRVTLEAALPVALKTAAQEFPDLDKYILYSVTPRVLKGDRRGLHWQAEWQEKTFPYRKLLRVRVYMKDGSTHAERLAADGAQRE